MKRVLYSDPKFKIEFWAKCVCGWEYLAKTRAEANRRAFDHVCDQLPREIEPKTEYTEYYICECGKVIDPHYSNMGPSRGLVWKWTSEEDTMEDLAKTPHHWHKPWKRVNVTKRGPPRSEGDKAEDHS